MERVYQSQNMFPFPVYLCLKSLQSPRHRVKISQGSKGSYSLYLQGHCPLTTCYIPAGRNLQQCCWRNSYHKNAVHLTLHSGIPRGGFGVFKPPLPKFWRPSKIVPNSTWLWKLLKIAEFRTPPPQDVRKKGSKILKLPRFAIVLH